MQIPDVLTYAWAIPATAFLMFWVTERSYSFSKSLDHIDYINSIIFVPTYKNGTTFQDGTDSLHGLYSIYFMDDLRYYLLRMHIYSASIIGLIVATNLWFGKGLVKTRRTIQGGKPQSTTVATTIHKRLGWVAAYLSIINLGAGGYTMFIYGMAPAPPVVENMDKTAWAVMVMMLPSGIYYGQQKNWKRHRICMILFATALFVIPVQRFLWFAGCQLFNAEDFNEDGGIFFGWVIDMVYYAMFISIGVGLLYAYSDSLGEFDKRKEHNNNAVLEKKGK